MNKTTLRWLYAFGGVLAMLVCFSFKQDVQSAEVNPGLRRNPTDVILPDWQGRWDCNLDGRQTTLEFRLVEDTLCQGNICQNIFRIAGRMLDVDGGETVLQQREYGLGDPPTARLDHLLPLNFNTPDGVVPMLLIMHTGNRQSSSGYVRWNGIPFGLQCRKSGAFS